MITEIETAALALITDRITGIGSAGVQKDARGKLINPTVLVACTDGAFTREGQVNWRQDLTLVILVTFKQLKGETERREGVNLLVQGIVQLLLNQTLNLSITRLKPKRWREATTEEQYSAGLIEYLIELETSFVMAPISDEAVTNLLMVGLNYYLKPDDDLVDAVDLVELNP